MQGICIAIFINHCVISLHDAIIAYLALEPMLYIINLGCIYICRHKICTHTLD